MAHEFHSVDDATVAIDDGGRIAVAWADQKRQDIFLQVYDPAGEAMLERRSTCRGAEVCSHGCRGWRSLGRSEPGVRRLAGNRLLRRAHGGEIFFARSTDGGYSFDTLVNLSDTTAGDGKGRLSVRSWHNGSQDLVLRRRAPCRVDRVRGRPVVPPVHRRRTDLRRAHPRRRGRDSARPGPVPRR